MQKAEELLQHGTTIKLSNGREERIINMDTARELDIIYVLFIIKIVIIQYSNK